MTWQGKREARSVSSQGVTGLWLRGVKLYHTYISSPVHKTENLFVKYVALYAIPSAFTIGLSTLVFNGECANEPLADFFDWFKRYCEHSSGKLQALIWLLLTAGSASACIRIRKQFLYFLAIAGALLQVIYLSLLFLVYQVGADTPTWSVVVASSTILFLIYFITLMRRKHSST